MVALSPKDGSLIWSFSGYQFGENSDPVLDDHRIYIMGHLHIYCVNKDDGSLIWSIKKVDRGRYALPLFDENFVYLFKGGFKMNRFDHSPILYCINKTSGEILWENELNETGDGVRFFGQEISCFSVPVLHGHLFGKAAPPHCWNYS